MRRLYRGRMALLHLPGWAAAVSALFSACAEVELVDPDAEQKARLRFGLVERLLVEGDPRSYFHVRIGSREGLDQIALEVRGGGEAFALPLAGANLQPCAREETCLSISLGPGFPEALDEIVLLAPEIGHEARAGIAVHRLSPHGLHASVGASNAAVEVTVVDPIRAHYASAEEVALDGQAEPTRALLFPRDFEVAFRPGACGDPQSRDAEWTAMTRTPETFPMPPLGGGEREACVAVRPAFPEGGAPVASSTVRAGAEVVKLRHVYSPPVELSPIVYAPLFDLEMPSAARCAEAQGLIESTLFEMATAVVETGRPTEVLALPTVQIATAGGALCRQANDRGFDPLSVAGQIEGALDAEFGSERRVRVVLVYANNIDLPLPEGVLSSMTALRQALGTRRTRASYLVALAPEGAIAGLGADRGLPWIATEEPAFRQGIQAELRAMWPFATSLHTAETRVPLLEASDSARYREFRLCGATHEILLEGDAVPGTHALRVGSGPPGYRVILTEQVLVESILFTGSTVIVDWEACADLCDRPAPGGDPRSSWQLEEDCQ